MFFGKRKLKKEIEGLKKKAAKQGKTVAKLRRKNKYLENSVKAKDLDLKKMTSDATRHGSSLGGKSLSDFKKNKKVK